MHPAYGWRSGHRQRRARLLPLAYGQPCPLCGGTMLPTQELHLDHTNPLDKDRGLPGDRIVHGTCNRRGLARLAPPDNVMTVREW